MHRREAGVPCSVQRSGPAASTVGKRAVGIGQAQPAVPRRCPARGCSRNSRRCSLSGRPARAAARAKHRATPSTSVRTAGTLSEAPKRCARRDPALELPVVVLRDVQAAGRGDVRGAASSSRDAAVSRRCGDRLRVQERLERGAGLARRQRTPSTSAARLKRARRAHPGQHLRRWRCPARPRRRLRTCAAVQLAAGCCCSVRHGARCTSALQGAGDAGWVLHSRCCSLRPLPAAAGAPHAGAMPSLAS
jgi:hypothetical protein